MLKKGDTCYFIENNHHIATAVILSVSGNLYTIKLGTEKAIRLPRHRIFSTEEEAKQFLPQKKKYKSPYDF